MRINGIIAKTKRKFKVTTHSTHKRPVADNLIKRDFRAPLTDTIWTSDITFIWTRQGWLYLAVFLDVCSRRIVGWSMSSRMTDQLVIDAFEKPSLGEGLSLVSLPILIVGASTVVVFSKSC